MLEDLAKVVTESWGQQKWSRVRGGEKQVSGDRVLGEGTRPRSPPDGTTRPSLPSVRVTCDSYHHRYLHPKATALSHPH